jgi:hypothetical protein
MTDHPTDNLLLLPNRPTGILGYGAYVPRYRLPAKEVARIWTDGQGGLPIKEKAVPGLDEDVITMSIEAARNALKRSALTRPRSGRSGSAPSLTRMPSSLRPPWSLKPSAPSPIPRQPTGNLPVKREPKP